MKVNNSQVIALMGATAIAIILVFWVLTSEQGQQKNSGSKQETIVPTLPVLEPETTAPFEVEQALSTAVIAPASMIDHQPSLSQTFHMLQQKKVDFSQLLQSTDKQKYHRFNVSFAKELETLQQRMLQVMPVDDLPVKETKQQISQAAQQISQQLQALHNDRVAKACRPYSEKQKEWQQWAENYALDMPTQDKKTQVLLKKNTKNSQLDLSLRLQACQQLYQHFVGLLERSEALALTVEQARTAQQNYVGVAEGQTDTHTEVANRSLAQAKKQAMAGQFSAAQTRYQTAITVFSQKFKQLLIERAIPNMIAVPAGTFTMGDTEGTGHEDELPRHQQRVEAFTLATTEVTVRQYQAFLMAIGENSVKDIKAENNNLPATDMSFSQAQAFISWLNQQTQQQYRLPSEIEWEYVAKREALAIDTSHCEGCQGWGNTSAQPVKSLAASKNGFYDLFGNVWEWVDGCYTLDYSLAHNTDANECQQHMVRGSSWADMPDMLRASNRSPIAGSTRSDRIGFRLAL